MKTLTITFFIVFGFLITSCAQDGIPQKQVPSDILNTFTSNFPNALATEWEKKGNMYEAEFVMDHTDHTAHIDESGKLVRHEYDISANDLSEAVKAAIESSYAGFIIEDAVRIQEGETVTFKVEIEKGPTDYEILYADNGTELRKVKD